MASSHYCALLVLHAVWTTGLASVAGTIRRHEQSRSLLQTWSGALNGQGAGVHETPVTRVVNLLKEMQVTLNGELEEDEKLFGELSCWCHTSGVEKQEAVEASQAKIQELGSTIERLTALSTELTANIKTLEETIANDKQALAEATAVREKEAAEFHARNLDSTEDVENLKAAITVLGRHHDSFAETSFESWDFLQVPEGWSKEDVATVRRALKSAAAFVQSPYNGPSYNPASGEIMGILKQMLETMMGDHAQAEKEENTRAAEFAELRAAKEEEIASNEKMAEKKEDELAQADMDNANAKEDKEQEEAALAETNKFLASLGGTCDEAEKNFAARKASRLEEIKAVSETIGILTEDAARDVMTSTYSFVQLSTRRAQRSQRQARQRAALALRSMAAKVRGDATQLLALATSVELNAFEKVKAEIDRLMETLKAQQAHEVEKNDVCISELHRVDMAITKANDRHSDLSAKSGELAEQIQGLDDAIASHKAAIKELQGNLQQATDDRVADNKAYQQTFTDQQAVVAVLKTALDRLAQFYEKESLLQRGSQTSRQTPPVAQMEYAPSKAAGGVMQMIEKLIQEANMLTEEAKKGETEGQVAYEAMVKNTNDEVAELSNMVRTKTKDRAQRDAEKRSTDTDIQDTEVDIQGLHDEEGSIHNECDFLMKNFDARQKARAEEMESLQTAKQILSGASFD